MLTATPLRKLAKLLIKSNNNNKNKQINKQTKNNRKMDTSADTQGYLFPYLRVLAIVFVGLRFGKYIL